MVVNPCHLFMAPIHLCFRCFQRKKLAQKVNEPGLTGKSIWAGLVTDIIKSSFPITSFKKWPLNCPTRTPCRVEGVLKGQASKTILSGRWWCSITLLFSIHRWTVHAPSFGDEWPLSNTGCPRSNLAETIAWRRWKIMKVRPIMILLKKYVFCLRHPVVFASKSTCSTTSCCFSNAYHF